jgi:DNA-binding NarL/FixJ family response regulator
MTTTIRILLVDDESSVRRGLRMQLELEPDLSVVGEASSGEEALALVPSLEPDVVLMDIQMRGMDGIAATRELAAQSGIAVVVLSLHDSRPMRRLAWSAGAREFVGKHETCDVLLAAIRRAHGRPAAVH